VDCARQFPKHFVFESRSAVGLPAQWSIAAANAVGHRVADKGMKSTKPPQECSIREYQRMNTAGTTTSDNLADFAEIQFFE
jgi:hypothetical protein